MIVVPDLTELVCFSFCFLRGGDVFEMRLISICIHLAAQRLEVDDVKHTCALRDSNFFKDHRAEPDHAMNVFNT